MSEFLSGIIVSVFILVIWFFTRPALPILPPTVSRTPNIQDHSLSVSCCVRSKGRWRHARAHTHTHTHTHTRANTHLKLSLSLSLVQTCMLLHACCGTQPWRVTQSLPQILQLQFSALHGTIKHNMVPTCQMHEQFEKLHYLVYLRFDFLACHIANFWMSHATATRV